MTHGLAKLDRDGDVAIITMDDPATRNALSWEMAEDLLEAFESIGEARALVIAGAGKGFCSGGNLGMDGAGEEGFGEVLKDGLSGSINPMLARHGESSEARQYSGRVVDEDWKCPLKDPRS